MHGRGRGTGNIFELLPTCSVQPNTEHWSSVLDVNNSVLGICISVAGLAREKYGQDKTRLRHSWAPLLNPTITLNSINQRPKNVLQDPPSFDSDSLFPFYLSLFLLTDPTWSHTACRSLRSTLPAVQVLATVHGPALQLLPL